MTQEINDGGPAFPCKQDHTINKRVVTINVGGMTLRDYFAGQALASGKWMYSLEGAGNTAMACYQIADAMIAEGSSALPNVGSEPRA